MQRLPPAFVALVLLLLVAPAATAAEGAECARGDRECLNRLLASKRENRRVNRTQTTSTTSTTSTTTTTDAAAAPSSAVTCEPGDRACFAEFLASRRANSGMAPLVTQKDASASDARAAKAKEMTHLQARIVAMEKSAGITNVNHAAARRIAINVAHWIDYCWWLGREDGSVSLLHLAVLGFLPSALVFLLFEWFANGDGGFKAETDSGRVLHNHYYGAVHTALRCKLLLAGLLLVFLANQTLTLLFFMLSSPVASVLSFLVPNSWVSLIAVSIVIAPVAPVVRVLVGAAGDAWVALHDESDNQLRGDLCEDEAVAGADAANAAAAAEEEEAPDPLALQ